MSQNGKLKPNLDQQSTKLLNLTVLQRIDPFVDEILNTATHVTFYQFDTDLSQWSRKDVEGSLFVVKRNTQPRFQFIVMNRLNTENLVEDLLGDFEYEVQLPYLLYRNAAREVNGIWFYNENECEDVANLFDRILSAYSKVPQMSVVSSTKREFEELEAAPAMAYMDGPLEPSSTAPNVTDVPDDHAFVNFFSAATKIVNSSTTTITRQPYQTSSTISPLSHPVGVASSSIPSMQIPSAPVLSSTNLAPFHEIPESHSNTDLASNLVKPSSFFVPPSSPATMVPPVSSSKPTAPLLHPVVSRQRPYGAPLLQPFPPPSSPPSLTPASFRSPDYGPVSRDKVRNALMLLVQDNQFIDMVYGALMKAHHS